MRFAWALAGLAVVLGMLVMAGRWRFVERRERVYPTETAALAIPRDAASIERGRHVARTLGGCTDCHGDDLGGKVMDEDAMVRVVASNLTLGRGSAIAQYGDIDWVRAILEGVGPDGRPLMVMPSAHLRYLADSDVAAIVAYMRTVAPVDRELPPSEATAIGEVVLGLVGADLWSAEQVDHTQPRAIAPPPVGPTRAYGEYLRGACIGCHGATLEGGISIHPKAPPSANISPAAMTSWTERGFVRAMRTGVRPDGSHVDDAMPWRATRELHDDEMHALWLALSSEPG